MRRTILTVSLVGLLLAVLAGWAIGNLAGGFDGEPTPIVATVIGAPTTIPGTPTPASELDPLPSPEISLHSG